MTVWHQTRDLWLNATIITVLFSVIVTLVIVGGVRTPMRPDVWAAKDAANRCGEARPPAGVTALGGGGMIFCINGEVDPKLATEFSKAVIKDGADIVLDSVGGDVAAALDMAEVIVAKHATVIVAGNCFSSCANYLFLAGGHKYVLSGGLVGFHGGPGVNGPVKYIGPESAREVSMRRHYSYVESVLHLQAALYGKLKIDSSIIYQAPGNVTISQADQPLTVWEYTPKAMRDRFGINGLEYFSDPDDRSWFVKMFGISCRKVEDDGWICST